MIALKVKKFRKLLVLYTLILVFPTLLFYFPKDVQGINNYKVEPGFTFTYLRINYGIPTVQYSYRIINISESSVKAECYTIKKNTSNISYMNFVEISGFLEDNYSIKYAALFSEQNETRVFGGRECECFVINLESNFESFIVDARTGLWLQYETFSEKLFLISWDLETSWFDLEDTSLSNFELTHLLGFFLLVPLVFVLFILYLYLDKKYFSSIK